MKAAAEAAAAKEPAEHEQLLAEKENEVKQSEAEEENSSNEIPQDKKEIWTTEITGTHPHLRTIADEIPPLNEVAKIQLLIGEDAPQLIKLVWAFKNMMARRAILLYLN